VLAVEHFPESRKFAMAKAESYRRRADGLSKFIKQRSKRHRGPILRRQKALRDMANNEDWLDGKPGSAIRPEKK
jgi:hypothetical protein